MYNSDGRVQSMLTSQTSRRGAATATVVALAAACSRQAAPAHTPSPWMRQPASAVTDLVRSEELAGEVSRAIKGTLILGFRQRRPESIAAALTTDFEGHLPMPGDAQWTREGPVWLWRAPAPERLAILRRSEFLSRIEAWIASLASLERASWHPFRSLAEEGNDPFVVQASHLDVAGVRPDGRRVELHATVRVEVVRSSGSWRMRRLAFEEASWSQSELAPFQDVAGVTGFDFHTSERAKKIRQAVIDDRAMLTSGGLTAMDFDKNGHWDVLATQWDGQAVLFLNDGLGGFRRQKLPAIDAAAATSKFYLWLDLDNDGQEELVGTQVLSPDGQTPAEVGLYTFKGGKMRRAKNALRFEAPPSMRRMDYEGITACDVNADGLLDLFFMGYDHMESKRTIGEDDGLRNLLFINLGGLRFREEAVARGLPETRYSFVAECYDFDEDGDPDVLVGNDYGTNDYYENLGKGQFKADTAHPFHQGPGFSMGLSIADFDNVGHYSISISNMYSHAGNRIVPLAEGLSPKKRKELMHFAGGNSLYERERSGWVDHGAARGVNVSGWAWGNVFFDLDNDGDKDLYVVNGHNSHSDPSLPDF